MYNKQQTKMNYESFLKVEFPSDIELCNYLAWISFLNQ